MSAVRHLFFTSFRRPVRVRAAVYRLAGPESFLRPPLGRAACCFIAALSEKKAAVSQGHGSLLFFPNGIRALRARSRQPEKDYSSSSRSFFFFMTTTPPVITARLETIATVQPVMSAVSPVFGILCEFLTVNP